MKYIFTLFILFTLLTAKSQEYLNWQKTIYGTAEKNDSATAIEAMDDEVMIAGMVNNSGTGLDAVINKYTPDGTLIWSGGYFTSTQDEVKSFQCNYHDYVFAVGSTGKSKNRNALIFALDDKGNNLWSKTFKGSYGGNDEFTNLKIAPDSSIVAVGETMISNIQCDGILTAYDQSGNLKWSRVFGSTGENEFNNIEFDNAGNIFVSGYVFDGKYKNGIVAEYSSSGNLINSISIIGPELGNYEVKSLAFKNGLLYTAITGPGGGPHTATIINAYDPSSFKVVWSQTYGNANFGFSIAGSFQSDNFGDILISGTKDSSGTNRFAAVSFDASSGAFNWSSIIGPELAYNYQVVSNTLDVSGNLIITGIRSTNATTLLQNGYAIYSAACDTKGAIVWTKLYGGNSQKNNSPSVTAANQVGEIFVAGQSAIKDQNGITSDDMLLLKYSGKEICSTPTGSSLRDTLSTSATIGWDAMPEAIRYRVQYRVHKIGTWTTVNTKTNSITLINLTPNTEYDWKVEMICSNNPFLSSPYSAVYLFKTAVAFQSFSTISNLNSNVASYHVYPNPAGKTISIEFNNDYNESFTIKIYDLAGKELQTKEFTFVHDKNVELDISKLLPGSYIISVKGKHLSNSSVLIKQ